LLAERHLVDQPFRRHDHRHEPSAPGHVAGVLGSVLGDAGESRGELRRGVSGAASDPGARIAESTAGWIVGCWGFGSWLASPVAGALTDRVGRRPTMLFGLMSNSLVVLALAFTRDIGVLFVLAFLGGATQQFYFPASNAAIADVIPRPTASAPTASSTGR